MSKQFRYEACWDIDECTEIIKSAWVGRVDGVNSVAVARQKLERCQKALSDWSSTKYGAANRSLKSLTK
jgi:hypothetical protein